MMPKHALTVDPRRRAALYNERFPDRPPLAFTDEWVTGTWAIGACWKNSNEIYGAYPRGYLERVHAMFPEARRILHAFSGGLNRMTAARAAWPWVSESESKMEDAVGPPRRPRWDGLVLGSDLDLDLVDLKGAEDGRAPTWQGDILEYCQLEQNSARFDLILADPPYSPEDAEKYGVRMPNRREVTRALAQVCRPGGILVWLDVVWPQHRKEEWRTWGQIGLVRSTNHRVRLVSFFERTA